ncbi:hypothetical protein MRB53_019272 [Persea americana]|uniref:Uncharacterized protein n=1 Tax=Persea americana TaxID=3435 RepID=A0ACC2KXR3_PERAE|nr:hypothetical protein MRB53_019272 [Persea americana]|eukprot:TRINITY_DN16103_c0_g1_i5.p1 TRINITY_DN16103_c0_g1~~TRINITY_DN16103_c0_g1_i5.p1  ORF type:complete len:105 (-),score=12.05 TRINITY_DN16103_c0_g1_i5:341-655(-)
MASASGPLLLMTVAGRLDDLSPSNEKGNPNPCWSRVALSKPSWIVRTESNVWRDVRKKPHPPCVVCKGSGRVDCHHCQGKGAGLVVEVALAIAIVVLGQENTGM